MKVLDHGEVTLVETWGSDENIIAAARQSTSGAFKRWGTPEDPGDERLLRYLYTHKHMTPFEMCGAIFEVKAPIFVFREWHRHRTQSYNEMSARYIPIPDENYLPTSERCLVVNGTNKQANRAEDASELTHEQALTWLEMLNRSYEVAQTTYTFGLEIGIPKELARLPMPVGRYSKMWASANLRNWMQFLELRNHSAAQWEIQQYAIAVQALLKERFPRTIELFEEERNV